jgi:hypothetical protein
MAAWSGFVNLGAGSCGDQDLPQKAIMAWKDGGLRRSRRILCGYLSILRIATNVEDIDYLNSKASL